MAKTFDFNRRSAELIANGASNEEAVAIMEQEEADADFTILDDGVFWAELANSFADIEAVVESELVADGVI